MNATGATLTRGAPADHITTTVCRITLKPAFCSRPRPAFVRSRKGYLYHGPGAVPLSNQYVLADAGLSYINIGVDPTMESWGNMINRVRLELAREPVVWWSLAAAFVFMFALVRVANLFADAVRDAFDPRGHAR